VRRAAPRPAPAAASPAAASSIECRAGSPFGPDRATFLDHDEVAADRRGLTHERRAWPPRRRAACWRSARRVRRRTGGPDLTNAAGACVLAGERACNTALVCSRRATLRSPACAERCARCAQSACLDRSYMPAPSTSRRRWPCPDVCADCEKICRKHDQHPPCKLCRCMRGDHRRSKEDTRLIRRSRAIVVPSQLRSRPNAGSRGRP
jgi:hypothetical protein